MERDPTAISRLINIGEVPGTLGEPQSRRQESGTALYSKTRHEQRDDTDTIILGRDSVTPEGPLALHQS